MAATPFYRDRAQAGHELARFALQQHVSADVVLAIPRGGVVVAEPVAQALEAPLDVIMARKVGAPMQPELALGAVTLAYVLLAIAFGWVLFARDPLAC